MKTAILCVGKLKEKHFLEAAREYEKRLSAFGGIETIECPDIREPKNASPADIKKVMAQEGATLLSKISPRDHVVALAIGGAMLDSVSFADRIAHLEMNGAQRIVFVIGGSNGLSNDVLCRANESISLSRMTFPHQLARIVLLEQIYRARKILSGETYHK